MTIMMKTGARAGQTGAAVLPAQTQDLPGPESVAQFQEAQDGRKRHLHPSAARSGDLPAHQSHRVRHLFLIIITNNMTMI